MSGRIIQDVASLRDYGSEVSLLNVPGYSLQYVSGYNPVISQGTTPEDVWQGGGLYPFLVAAQPLEVLSTNAGDSAAGAGTQVIRIVGLDANYIQINELVTLNGTTPVVTTKSYLRVNDCRQVRAGSNQINLGDITVRTNGTSIVQAVIATGFGRAQQAIYSVPAGFTLMLSSVVVSLLRAGGTQAGELHLMTRQYGAGWTVALVVPLSTAGASAQQFSFTIPPIIGLEGADIRWSCPLVSANNTIMTASMTMLQSSSPSNLRPIVVPS